MTLYRAHIRGMFVKSDLKQIQAKLQQSTRQRLVYRAHYIAYCLEYFNKFITRFVIVDDLALDSNEELCILHQNHLPNVCNEITHMIMASSQNDAIQYNLIYNHIIYALTNNQDALFSRLSLYYGLSNLPTMLQKQAGAFIYFFIFHMIFFFFFNLLSSELIVQKVNQWIPIKKKETKDGIKKLLLQYIQKHGTKTMKGLPKLHSNFVHTNVYHGLQYNDVHQIIRILCND